MGFSCIACFVHIKFWIHFFIGRMCYSLEWIPSHGLLVEIAMCCKVTLLQSYIAEKVEY